ncbi:MAG: hypothetical protein EPN85_03430 [Bacteroidetes bacterium]|nr:MAG: hypothetical protein EPN85_03430 [Bacteroidota bacterium]
MQTVLRIKPSELNSHFLQALKSLFKDAAGLEIIVNTATTADTIFSSESRSAYWKRINKAIKDVEDGKNVISFTAEEFEKYSDKLASKHKG